MPCGTTSVWLGPFGLRSAALRAYAVLTPTAQVRVWKPCTGGQGPAPAGAPETSLRSVSGALDRLDSLSKRQTLTSYNVLPATSGSLSRGLPCA